MHRLEWLLAPTASRSPPWGSGPAAASIGRRACSNSGPANVPAAAETFVLRGGPPKIYIKTAESGNKRAHAFCPGCGSPIYASAISNPPTYSLRIGSIKQRKELMRPKRQIWCNSALPWSMDIRDVPQSSQQ